MGRLQDVGLNVKVGEVQLALGAFYERVSAVVDTLEAMVAAKDAEIERLAREAGDLHDRVIELERIFIDEANCLSSSERRVLGDVFRQPRRIALDVALDAATASLRAFGLIAVRGEMLVVTVKGKVIASHLQLRTPHEERSDG